MTKSNITEYDKVAANNTDVEDVPLGENQMYPADVNNAFREVMADLADVNDGTVALTSPKATAFEVTNNITVGGTVDGRDVATDGTKLDGVEAGATADQTAAEIRTLVDSATDSNVFTDADHSKLDGIAAGAEVNTVDSVNTQTGVVVLNADDISDASTTNKYTTASDISKLAGIEALADVTDATNVAAAGAAMLTGATFTGNVNVNGSFDASSGIFIGGTNSYIYEGAANQLNFRIGADGPYAEMVDVGGGVMEFGNAGGELALTAAGTERARVTSGGLEVTGNVVSQVSINAQTGTTYTTVLADQSKLVTLTNASAITVTIPANSSVAYPVGTKIDFAQLGAGQVTFAGAGGVTVNSTPTLKLRDQYSGASCIKTATDTWLLVGDLATS